MTRTRPPPPVKFPFHFFSTIQIPPQIYRLSEKGETESLPCALLFIRLPQTPDSGPPKRKNSMPDTSFQIPRYIPSRKIIQLSAYPNASFVHLLTMRNPIPTKRSPDVDPSAFPDSSYSCRCCQGAPQKQEPPGHGSDPDIVD